MRQSNLPKATAEETLPEIRVTVNDTQGSHPSTLKFFGNKGSGGFIVESGKNVRALQDWYKAELSFDEAATSLMIGQSITVKFNKKEDFGVFSKLYAKMKD
jgi:hypothetical protein